MKKALVFIAFIPFLLSFNFTADAAEREDQQWQDESIYYIVVDRFMNGEMSNNEAVDLEDPKAYHGGDLSGIVDQLDYIKEMGFTTIQLSPIMENEKGGFHGFQVSDYRKVEEHFGTMDEAERVVEEAHARDLKVIFDLPAGFISKNHPWVNDETKSPWVTGNPVESEHPWFNQLPQVNLNHEAVQNYFKETMDYWREETGVDGFRIIVSDPVSGEFPLDDSPNTYIESIQESNSFRNMARKAFRKAGQFLDDLETGENHQQVNQIDFYDISRFTHEAVEEGQNPITRWKLALTYMFTAPGIPSVYYGTETPMDDGGDPQNLPMMNFKSGDEQLKQRIEKLSSMREQFPALTRGDYQELYNEEGLAVFIREYDGQQMVIAINNSEETKSMSLEELEDGLQLRGLLHDGLVRQRSDGSYRLGMERETADVFIVEANSGYNWLFIGFVGGVLALFVIAVVWISLKNRKQEK
ncbi:alpha-amylase [Halobacillus karajensis]|uniref:Beta/alpha-amylase n=1 Tax=Halobacillus karajensis TaxID=195088 RepID=A0A024P7R0_9BACI|nr:alpha-amylase family glycosyl hydrolase [Halobacillus karajensis]CDQ21058.1 Beta/alpha-amylase precursor [Halobacillus karajensis]CDQ24878.1 Beta/alpha-amylase precursor [Halobacillus karajensis]CDQ28762.1 Beta/alpha-amylase precursor [Halobacillus karajensis]SEH96810.1 alpha-amylase [Halobacillus karajensis]